MFNDGTAMVIFLVLLDIVEGKPTTPAQIIGKFCRLSFGGPALGLSCGVFVQLILSKLHNDFVLEINTTFVAAYIIFFIAEGTQVQVSGILALVFLGLFMNKQGKTRISVESEHAMHHVWGYIGFMAETIIFILSGVIMGIRVAQGNHKDATIVIDWRDFLLVFANYLMLHVIRFSMIGMFWPILRKLGYGMEFRQVILCSYAGLRGAVGLALALIVVNSKDIN